jgi:hypothetical protein
MSMDLWIQVARMHLVTAALACASGRQRLGAYWVNVALIALRPISATATPRQTRVLRNRGGA